MTASLLTLAAWVILGVGLGFFGRRKPGYSHCRHTISELAETGSPVRREVELGVFLPVGLLMAVVAVFRAPENPWQALVAAALATGYLLSIPFPCDPGAPMSGSWKNGLHNLGGGIEYAASILGLFRLGEEMGGVIRFAGPIMVVCVVLLSFESPIRGLAQRIGEAVVFATLMASIGWGG